jgi:hypothetical protein
MLPSLKGASSSMLGVTCVDAGLATLLSRWFARWD